MVEITEPNCEVEEANSGVRIGREIIRLRVRRSGFVQTTISEGEHCVRKSEL